MKQSQFLLTSIAALCTVACLPTLAQSSYDSDKVNNTGWYAGANAGRSSATVDNARITRELAANGLATTSIADRERSTGYKLYGGYKFNPNFALEGGYVDLGKFGFTANTLPAGSLNGDIRLRGFNLDAVGILPLSERFSAQARIGLASMQARDNFSGTGAVGVSNPNPSKRATNYKVGLGLEYAISPNLGLRGDLERYRVNDAVGNRGNIDMISVGLVYYFGGKTQTAPRAAYVEPPAPVAVTVAPAPIYVAPVPAPVVMPRKVSFSADALFDFDKSAVKPAGKLALDKFATELKGTQYDAIKVTGHTDRLGSHAYNLKLSTRRAQAVSSYLAESAGIAAAKISTAGVDGANPVTKPGDCVGSKPTAKLIACLQPDRRVDVEVTGTK
jgi:OOP family OmpA-OmpF porin